jgi:hypothetical protein
MAPEMVRGEWYDEKADIWSFGISLCELANRTPPGKGNEVSWLFSSALEGLKEPLHSHEWSQQMREFFAKV